MTTFAIAAALVAAASAERPTPGADAPAFSLQASNGKTVSLSDFKGQADVVVLFYCYDWGGI